MSVTIDCPGCGKPVEREVVLVEKGKVPLVVVKHYGQYKVMRLCGFCSVDVADAVVEAYQRDEAEKKKVKHA